MRLYKLDSKGKLRVIYLYRKDNVLYSESGIHEGIMKQSSKVYEANSRFTSNERCITALLLKVKNKKKNGYIADRELALKGGVFIPKPMLISRYTPGIAEFPLLVQPKLDGVRALYKDGSFTTRNMEPLVVPHITEKFAGYLDGELYAHGEALQDIIGCTRKTNSLTSKIKYYVFDKPGDISYGARLDLLKHMDLPEGICVVDTVQVHSEEELEAYYDKCLSVGLEGVVVKDQHGSYEWNHRSKSCWKKKPVFSKEFRVYLWSAEYRPGVGKLIEFYCECDAGEFKVIPAWDVSQRQEAMANPDAYIGKMLTVEYRGLSKDGIPLHAVGKVFRDDL